MAFAPFYHCVAWIVNLFVPTFIYERSLPQNQFIHVCELATKIMFYLFYDNFNNTRQMFLSIRMKIKFTTFILQDRRFYRQTINLITSTVIEKYFACIFHYDTNGTIYKF